MTASRVPSLQKEARALGPAALAALVAVLIGSRLPATSYAGAGLAAYVFGTALIGALSMGHEYNARTLEVLLAQPRSRREVFRTKAAVLVPTMAIFAGVSSVLLVRSLAPLWAGEPAPWTWALAAFLLPALGGVCLAPSLTMLCRSALAGTVFTMVVPGLLWVASTAVASAAGSDRPQTIGFLALNAGMVTLCAAGAAIGWRMFERLEAVGDGGRTSLRPSPSDRSEAPANPLATSRRSHPLWLLAKKEFRLQQLAFAVAALYVATWALASTFDHDIKELPQIYFALSFLYMGLTALLIGSTASAEERQLGTAEWQALLPMATATQWLVKIGVASGLTLTLTVALPGLVAWLSPSTGMTSFRELGVPLAAQTLGLMVVGVYVSSFCQTVVWALLLSLPVAPVAWTLGAYLIESARHGQYGVGWNVLRLLVLPWFFIFGGVTSHSLSSAVRGFLFAAEPWTGSVAAAGLAVVALTLGLHNHRSADRSVRRAWRHAGAIGIYLLVALNVVIGWQSLAVRASWDPVLVALDRLRYEAMSPIRERGAHWQQALHELTAGFDGRVGVCASSRNWTECVRGDEPFPMQSVWKLPLAVAVLDAGDRGAWRLDERIVVRPQDLSVFVQPLAKLVGPSGFTTTIDDLVRRAIVDSDNAAADILLARLGGPAAIQVALGHHAIVGIRVDRDEKHLQTDINGLAWRAEYLDPAALDHAIAAVPDAARGAAFQAYLRDDRDTATPRAMGTLLDQLADGYLLKPASTAHLLDLLGETKTFPDRPKAGVPPGWTLGHKTGTSGDWRGMTAATNDVGLLRAPDGGYVSVSVFIAGSRASAADRAALMAHIAAAIAAAY